MAHIRVYDPRGFEFEISVENLLFVLEECSSIKGKGLEGEFVYAWDKSDLVLLPVCSADYKLSAKYTAGLNSKVTKNDMKEGCLYRLKSNMEVVMYLGKQKWFDVKHYNSDTLYEYEDKGEKHIFAYPGKKDKYDTKYFSDIGFTKLSAKISDEVSPDFAEEYSEFKKSLEGAGVKEVVIVPGGNEIPKDYYISRYNKYLIKENEEYYIVNFNDGRNYFYGKATTYNMETEYKVVISGNSVKYEKFSKVLRTITHGDLTVLPTYKLVAKTYNNKTMNMSIN
jgi:hypothetical protein